MTRKEPCEFVAVGRKSQLCTTDIFNRLQTPFIAFIESINQTLYIVSSQYVTIRTVADKCSVSLCCQLTLCSL